MFFAGLVLLDRGGRSREVAVVVSVRVWSCCEVLELALVMGLIAGKEKWPGSGIIGLGRLGIGLAIKGNKDGKGWKFGMERMYVCMYYCWFGIGKIGGPGLIWAAGKSPDRPKIDLLRGFNKRLDLALRFGQMNYKIS